MKKLNIINASIYIIIIITIILLITPSKLYFQKKNDQLVYDYKNSWHNDFYFEREYVVFRNEIKIKNPTANDLYFYMSADVSEDFGLVLQDAAIACKQDSLQKEKFFIKAKSEQLCTVYFKAKKGVKETKSNRLPPQKITFEILKPINSDEF